MKIVEIVVGGKPVRRRAHCVKSYGRRNQFLYCFKISLCPYSSEWSASSQNYHLNLIEFHNIQMIPVKGPHYVKYDVEEVETVGARITYCMDPLYPKFHHVTG